MAWGIFGYVRAIYPCRLFIHVTAQRMTQTSTPTNIMWCQSKTLTLTHAPYITSQRVISYIGLCWSLQLGGDSDYVPVWIRMNPASAFSDIYIYIFLQPHNMTQSTVNSAQMYCSRTHTFHFSATFLLKMGPTILFTHLKIILLQCFQFQFSVSVKINSIQTDPLCATIEIHFSLFLFGNILAWNS